MTPEQILVNAAVSCPEIRVDLAAEVLRRFGEIRFVARGASMIPAIYPGDLLTVRSHRIADARSGEIVLCLREGRFWLIASCANGGMEIAFSFRRVATPLRMKIRRWTRANCSAASPRSFATAGRSKSPHRRSVDEDSSNGCAPFERAGENAALQSSAAHAASGWIQRSARPAQVANFGVPVMAPALSTLESASATPHIVNSATVNVEIGEIPILLQPDHSDFCELLERRYLGFISPHSESAYRFDIHLDSTGRPSDEDARVFRSGELWNFQRGDFHAQWNPHTVAAGFVGARILTRSIRSCASRTRWFLPSKVASWFTRPAQFATAQLICLRACLAPGRRPCLDSLRQTPRS